MPSGNMHAAMTVSAAAGLAAAGYLSGLPESATLALTLGCMAGLVLTPDLDVDEPVRSHALIRREAGRLPAAVWRVIWLPYSRLLPHRHWLSHTPLISTVFRVGYLALIAWLVFLLFGRPWPWSSLPAWWLFALSGLVVSDALHWAADTLNSGRKGLFRRRRRWV